MYTVQSVSEPVCTVSVARKLSTSKLFVLRFFSQHAVIEIIVKIMSLILQTIMFDMLTVNAFATCRLIGAVGKEKWQESMQCVQFLCVIGVS